jgi:hypothetical protein
MADAASPHRTPGRSGTPVLAIALIVLALLVGVLVLVFPSSSDEPAASGAPARAELLALPAGLPDAPDAAPSVAPLPADSDIDPLADPSAGESELSLRRIACIMSWWDRPFAGANERAPCTLIVVDDHERPVPDARVQVWGEEDEPVTAGGGELGRVVVSRAPPIGPIPYVTDAQGRCTVQPPLHTPQVLVEKEGVGCSGWVSLDRAYNDRQARELLVPLQRPARIRGLVVQPDEKPAPGVSVSVETRSAPGAPLRVPRAVVTGADGRFELAVDGGGNYRFDLDDAARTSSSRRIEVAPGAVQDVVLRQLATWTISGQVMRPLGSPVTSLSDWSVTFWPEPRAELGDADLRHRSKRYLAKTDDDGRFEIEIDRPMQGLVVTCGEAWGLADPPRVLVDAEHPHVEVELRLCEPAWIEGRCVDEQGAPVVGEAVRCKTAESLAPAARATNLSLFGDTQTVTAADGTFRLGPLHPRGLYDLWAYIGEDDERRTLSARAVPPGTRDLLFGLGSDREMNASVTLLVHSGDAGGGPVSKGSVRVARRMASGAWTNTSYESVRDDYGLATLDGYVPGTELCLVVRADGLGTAVVSDVVASVEGTELMVVLPPLASVDVVVTDDGAPAAWAIVTRSRRSESCAAASMWERESSQRADAAGHLALTGLDPGLHRFTITHGEHSARREVDIAPGEAALLSFDLR